MKTLQDELIQKKLTDKPKKQKKKRKKKPSAGKEKLSRYDIEELMGVKRPTYTRVRGAIRNK